MNKLYSLIHRHPSLFVFIIATITAYSAWYGQRHFEVNADLSSLVQQEGEWVENLKSINQAFPNTGNVLVLVSSESSDNVSTTAAKTYTKNLAQAFSQETIFTDVFAPSTLSWFERYALGFLSESAYSNLEQRFENQVAPAVVGAKTQSLENYLALIAEHAKKSQDPLAPLLTATSGKDVDWQALIQASIALPQNHVITLTAEPDNTLKNPNQQVIAVLDQVLSQVEKPEGVNVTFTGQTPLDYDEIQDANSSITLAGSTSLFGLLLILAIGIRSFRVIAACYTTVLVGLTWTFAAGLAVVGHFSTISIVFMVMFIGLAVDFAIHLCLHIQELRASGKDNQTSLKHALSHSFRPLGLCALSSGIGFMSFYPTAYTGLGELGVISALGMLLGLLATFTVIPLFFHLFGYPTVRHDVNHGLGLRYGKWLVKQRTTVVTITALLFVFTVIGASQFKFDFSTLVLKNQESESVMSLNRLQSLGLGSSYQLNAIAQDNDQAEQWKKQLLKLDTVSNVTIANDFLPKNWIERQSKLASALSVPLKTKSLDYSSFKAIAIDQQWPDAERLPDSLTQENAYHLFHGTQVLAQSMTPQPMPLLEDIPSSLIHRYKDSNGQFLLTIVPKGDMTEVESVQRFIYQVQDIAPNATGRAVAEQQVGKIIVRSFQIAIAIAVVAITLLLATTIRRASDIILIFIPLTLASLTTLGMMHWLNLSLNMANIIVIPLIFGLGVDNGIHIVNRFRTVGTIDAFFATSTPKATIVSCLSTLTTFGALILANHQGMHSIGLVLTIALSSILIYSLVLLPVSLEMTRKPTLDKHISTH